MSTVKNIHHQKIVDIINAGDWKNIRKQFENCYVCEKK